MLSSSDIFSGMALFLDPSELAEYGGMTVCPLEVRIAGTHYFVCLDVRHDISLWTAVSSQAGSGRLVVPAADKYGHPQWTLKTSYIVHPNQTWYAPNYAVIEAAGSDRSRPGKRNGVTDACLASLLSHCELPRLEDLEAVLDPRFCASL